MTDAASDTGGGPVMLAATALMRPGPARIGSLGKNVTLPRTVRVNVLISCGVFTLPGMAVGGIVSSFVGGFRTFIMITALFAAIGYLAVSWSPLPGESLLQWLNVVARSRQGRLGVQCDGSQQPGGARYRDDNDRIMVRCEECGQDIEADIDGTPAVHRLRRRVYVGICPLARTAAGEVRIVSSSVEVVPGTVDAEGLPVKVPALRDPLAAWAAGYEK